MTQLLPLILVAIPLFACLVSSLHKQDHLLLRLLEGALPILFFATLLGLHRQVQNDEVFRFIHLDKTVFLFLLLLNFLWLVFIFYMQRFWQLSSEAKTQKFN